MKGEEWTGERRKKKKKNNISVTFLFSSVLTFFLPFNFFFPYNVENQGKKQFFL